MVDRSKLIDVCLHQPAGHIVSVGSTLVSGVVAVLAWGPSATASEATPEEAASEGSRRRHRDAAADLTSDLIQAVSKGAVDGDHDQRQPHAHRQHRDQQAGPEGATHERSECAPNGFHAASPCDLMLNGSLAKTAPQPRSAISLVSHLHMNL